jgi:hypothetical protein
VLFETLPALVLHDASDVGSFRWHADWAGLVLRARPGVGVPTRMEWMPFPWFCSTKCSVSVQTYALLMSLDVLHVERHADVR